MHIKIDWLSFTIPVRLGVENGQGFAVNVENAFFDTFGKDITDQCFGGKWQERPHGRAPYSNSYDVLSSDAVAFINPRVENCLVEYSGKGCDKLRELGALETILETVKNRVTRLDLACDIETDVDPVDFAPKGQYATSATYSDMVSKTGKTVYVGSQASERYTRVYRYNAPHPRSKLLRVEFVFRRKVARAVAQKILDGNEAQVAAWAGDKANFHHASWLPSDAKADITAFPRPEREAGKTVFWLIKSVSPAFVRLVREGVIADPEQFLQQFFLSPLER